MTSSGGVILHGESILHGQMLRYIFCEQIWGWEKTCFAEWRSIRVVSKNIRGECRQLEEIVRLPFISDSWLKRFLLLEKPRRNEAHSLFAIDAPPIQSNATEHAVENTRGSTVQQRSTTTFDVAQDSEATATEVALPPSLRSRRNAWPNVRTSLFLKARVRRKLDHVPKQCLNAKVPRLRLAQRLK